MLCTNEQIVSQNGKTDKIVVDSGSHCGIYGRCGYGTKNKMLYKYFVAATEMEMPHFLNVCAYI